MSKFPKQTTQHIKMTAVSQITKMLELLGEEFDFDATEALDFLKEEAPELLKKSEKKSEKTTPRKSRKGVVTGWMLFRRENKGNMKEQSVQWKALTDDERAEFGDRAKEMNANRSDESPSVSPSTSPNKKSRKGVLTGWMLFRRENKGNMKDQSVQWKALSDDESAEFGERAKEMNASR